MSSSLRCGGRCRDTPSPGPPPEERPTLFERAGPGHRLSLSSQSLAQGSPGHTSRARDDSGFARNLPQVAPPGSTREPGSMPLDKIGDHGDEGRRLEHRAHVGGTRQYR